MVARVLAPLLPTAVGKNWKKFNELTINVVVDVNDVHELSAPHLTQ